MFSAEASTTDTIIAQKGTTIKIFKISVSGAVFTDNPIYTHLLSDHGHPGGFNWGEPKCSKTSVYCYVGSFTEVTAFRIDTSVDPPTFLEYTGLSFAAKAIGIDPTSNFMVTATKDYLSTVEI